MKKKMGLPCGGPIFVALQRYAERLVAVAVVVTTVTAAVVVVATALFVAMELIMTVGMIAFMTSPCGVRAMIAVARIIVIVHIAVEAMRTAEPWASTDEDAAGKPLRSVVAIGSAIIGGVVIVAVGTDGCGAIETETWAFAGEAAKKESPMTTAKAARYFVTLICSPRVIRTASDGKSCAKRWVFE